MFAIYKKVLELTAAVKAGDVDQIGDATYLLLGWLLGKQPIPMMAGEADAAPSEEMLMAASADLCVACAEPPRGAGGVVLMMVIQAAHALGPVIKLWVENRRNK